MPAQAITNIVSPSFGKPAPATCSTSFAGHRFDGLTVFCTADPNNWIKLSVVDKPAKQLQVERATSALADVDTAGWTLRFDLLSDPNRLEILLCLHRAPGICVGDLAAALGRSENAVSQALRVLRQQGWVSSTRTGREVSYRLEDEIVHELLHRIGAQHG